MSEVLTLITDLETPFDMIVLVVLFVMVANVISNVAREIRKYASHREASELIRDLASQGMNADEIERLLPDTSDAARAVSAGRAGGGKRRATVG